MIKFLEIDPNKTYGTFTKDSIVYYHLLPWYKRPLRHMVCGLQWVMWKCGYSWYNWFTDECCPDFSCCRGK